MVGRITIIRLLLQLAGQVQVQVLVQVLVLVLVLRCGVSSGQQCQRWQELEAGVVHKDGDVILAGTFPIHSKAVEQELDFTRPPGARRCQGLNLRGLRWSQAMIFFIEEINQNEVLLPNLTLGYRLYDTCWHAALSTRSALSALAPPLSAPATPSTNSSSYCSAPSVPLLIGDSGSSLSIAISTLLNPFHIPLISYFSTCPCLSNKRRFPYFFRTVPSDIHQARALAHFAIHFRWTWVGALHSDDDYGRAGTDAFAAELSRLGGCLAFRLTLPKTGGGLRLRDIANTVVAASVDPNTSVRVVVAFVTEEDLQPLAEELSRQNVTHLQWLASEAWVTSTLLAASYPSLLQGALGFALRRADMPGLRRFLDGLRPFSEPYNLAAQEFWETQFRCSFSESVGSRDTGAVIAEWERFERRCTGDERLNETESIYNDVSQLRVTYNVGKAVYAVAQALHHLLLTCRNQGGKRECPDIRQLQPWQLVRYLRQVNFSSAVFEDSVYFDDQGDPAASYDIVNWQKAPDGGSFVTVGRFDSALPPELQLVIHEDMIVWQGPSRQVPVSRCRASCVPGFRKATRKGEPVCCYDCVQCDEGTISNGTDQSECTACPEDLWSNPRRDACTEKPVEFLSFTEAFGIALSSAALLGVLVTMVMALVFLRHRDTPLVRANNSELSFLLLLALALCFLCALTFLGRPSRWSCPLRRTAFGVTFALCLSCLLSKTLVVLAAFRARLPGNDVVGRWFRPPQQRLGVFVCSALQGGICLAWLGTSPPFPAKNGWLYRDRTVLECQLGSVALFSLALGYIGLLAAVCLVLAFLARKLPDNFNEAKLITFSMLIFCAVWIAYVPAYVSSPGKFTVAVEIFAILASSYGVLLCIFAPKCYIIVFRPEKNTKKYLMAQKAGR